MTVTVKSFALSHKKLIILVVSTLAVLGALLWVTLLLISNNRQAVSTLTLHKNPDVQAATYNGVPIIEACNIVSLEELGTKGIKLKGTTYPKTFVRTYIEGARGDAPLPDDIELENRPNSCHYRLQGEGDLFDIAIYQSSYSDMEAFEAKIASQYNDQPNIGDMKVYKAETYYNRDEDFFNTVSTNEGNEDFIVRKGDAALWFRLRGFEQATRQEVLRMIAASFSELLQKPETRVTIDYRDSPIHGKLYKACELLTAEDATLLLGQTMSPVVKEGYGGAPDTRNYVTSHGRPKGYEYVTQECERSGSNEKVSHARLALELRQYATEEGAKHFIKNAAAGDNGRGQALQTIGLGLGDEAYVDVDDSDKVPLGDTIHVRKGPLVLTFSYYLGSYRQPAAETSIRLLEPVVTKILEKLAADSR